MWKIDKILLCALVIGVWALVLKPTATTAHDDGHSHACDGTGHGELQSGSRDVWIYSLDIDCD
mgnify:FL=1|jgi:hypothetical protein